MRFASATLLNAAVELLLPEQSKEYEKLTEEWVFEVHPPKKKKKKDPD